jgi:NAD+ kinase
LLLAHTGRVEAREVARAICAALVLEGIGVRLLAHEAVELELDTASVPLLESTESPDDAGHGCELAIVIGGDGTILRAAEITHRSGTPLLGVNSAMSASWPRPRKRSWQRRSRRWCAASTRPRTG